jgi:hypothetical protein
VLSDRGVDCVGLDTAWLVAVHCICARLRTGKWLSELGVKKRR